MQDKYILSQDGNQLLFMRLSPDGVCHVEHRFTTPFYTERHAQVAKDVYEFELAKARLWYKKN